MIVHVNLLRANKDGRFGLQGGKKEKIRDR